MFEPPYYPILLIRGFAATEKDIVAASNQVFLGFEEGSTRSRQDSTGAVRRSFFESVVVRLAKDEGYRDSYSNNLIGYDDENARITPRSIWTHRYYDRATDDFGDGRRLTMESYAEELREVILRIRDKVCGDDLAARAAFKVHLVAHSMGGLVARCYLQRICPKGVLRDGNPAAKAARDAELELTSGGADPLVAGLFSYGVPHNGIDLLGLNVPDLGPLSLIQARNFDRDVIRSYLNLDRTKAANDLDGTFDADRVFCLIGTNWRDYDIAISRTVTRDSSDGLVMCANAYTVDRSVPQSPRQSPRAYVHRAHGGPFGMVNSEEGYQNLRRFLFGNWRVDVELVVDGFRLPDTVVKKARQGQRISGNYRLDVIGSVRKLPVRIHERREHTASSIRYVVDHIMGPDPTARIVLSPLEPAKTVASIFLDDRLSADTREGASGPVQFALRLAMETPAFELDRQFLFDQHLEGLKVFDNTYSFRLDPKANKVSYGLVETIGLGKPATPVAGALQGVSLDGFVGEIPFGPDTDAKLKSGQARGRLVINVRHHLLS